MIYYFKHESGLSMSLQPQENSLQNSVNAAVEILASGGVVAIPTDTLYGLAANVFNQSAVERVFALKGRPAGVPMPVLLADAEDAARCAAEVPEIALRLAERFWPGALTLVLRKSTMISNIVTGGLDTVAVRVPDHPVPRAIVRKLGAPVTGTSANRSGEPGITSAAEVRRVFGGQVDMIIDGGDSAGGVASTVLDLTGDVPRILRQGAISAEAISKVCGFEVQS